MPAEPVAPKRAKVSLVALPGGSIFLDGKPVGDDETAVLTLKPGNYLVRVENRFIGNYETVVAISEGQAGVVKVEW